MKDSKFNYHKKVIYQRSDAVNEILGTPPEWIIRWGITVVFVIVILLIAGSALIKYNDIATAQIVITTDTPPAYVEAMTTGKINELIVEADDKVMEGSVLAEIENSARMKDVLFLKDKLEGFLPKLMMIDSINDYFPYDLVLGDLSELYSDFVSNYQKYILYENLKPNQHEILNATDRINQQKELLNKQKKQLTLYEGQLELAELDYNRNKILLEKGVISDGEFNKVKMKFLEAQQSREKLEEIISYTKISITSINGKKVQSSILNKELTHKYRHELNASLENLKIAIYEWELKYLMKSPMDGIVSMFDIRNKYQNVNQGDIVFTIVPENIDTIIGLVTMPVKNSGKVKIGQKVIIKLENFPYQEWGSLEGKIENISAVPKKGEAMYSIYVSIEDLSTSFNRKIKFRQEMHGHAEIVLEEITILQRVFYTLNGVFSRNH